MTFNVSVPEALPALPVPAQPWGSTHPAHGPGTQIRPLTQWHHSRADLQLPTALPCPAMGPD